MSRAQSPSASNGRGRRWHFAGSRWVLLAATVAFFWSSVAEARSRRRRRRSRRPAKVPSKYQVPAGSASHVFKPLEAIGVDRKEIKRITKALRKALVALPKVKLAPRKLVKKFLKSRYGATHKVCEGELDCLVGFGKRIAAPLVIAGDLSGLATGYVLFLRLIDPAAGKVVRKVSVVKGAKSDESRVLREAAFKLLAPDRFVGKLALEVDVKGASVFLDGKPLGQSPVAIKQVVAGTHALRVTHAKFHDFMRFVRVAFDKTTTIKVSLKQYPIISEEMTLKARRRRARPKPRVVYLDIPRKVIIKPLPWYKKWWFITTVGVVLLAGTVTTVALVRSRHLERDGEVTLSREMKARRLLPAPVFRFFGP